MAATVRPIEAKSVHQIQSGQVIVDLCSVVKELVENSLDAGANNIEVRFKNNGLDEIEVQDNGAGIAAVNYESVALKHHTSKLATYDDLSTLQTFGFRGEALSSLCALSNFTIITAQAHEAPKGNRLEFEVSGRLKGTSVVACQKGTTATVHNLFEKLPVRRKELSKNIKREYGKVLGLLHAYACISTNTKFTVKNTIPKGKSMTIFATKSNATTRENIANVYGAKTMSALVALELDFDFRKNVSITESEDSDLTKVAVRGHISKPVFGEGRQTPDRQMFFVNGRPCGLPQIAKAINEVYKSFNVSQSPFIFADFQMNTAAYDVNVSPDKRTIFLHDATALIESLKNSLTELFDQQDQTVPQSRLQSTRLPAFKQPSLQRASSTNSSERSASENFAEEAPTTPIEGMIASMPQTEEHEDKNLLLHDHFRNVAGTREEPSKARSEKQLASQAKEREQRALKVANPFAQRTEDLSGFDEYDDVREFRDEADRNVDSDELLEVEDVHVRNFNARMAEQQIRKRPRLRDENESDERNEQQDITSVSFIQPREDPGVVPSAFDRMRPKRMQPEVVTITIGDKTVTRIIGSQPFESHGQSADKTPNTRDAIPVTPAKGVFGRSLERFSAPGAQWSAEEETSSQDGHDNDSVVHDAQRELERIVDNDIYDRALEKNDATSADLRTRYRNNSCESELSYDDEKAEREAEEDRVVRLIQAAENTAVRQSSKAEKRTAQALKSGRAKDSVFSVACNIELDIDEVMSTSELYRKGLNSVQLEGSGGDIAADLEESPEERLSLTVSKADFFNMHIVGQFNLGFIIAVRQGRQDGRENGDNKHDELFIIDQHASDEKYNFERLQAETIVGNQRMVRPVVLDLTAVEEEIVIDNTAALEKNGFVVDVDFSGQQEVGKRCRLTSLPLSKEVVFGTQDLDELIHLLAESPMLSQTSAVPRPSKVRKMFAMRACRSSIMIGKNLSHRQMSTVLQHMGSIDKPWNCPHGRPTMRHLTSLDALDRYLWIEGDGVLPGEELSVQGSKSAPEVWRSYLS